MSNPPAIVVSDANSTNSTAAGTTAAPEPLRTQLPFTTTFRAIKLRPDDPMDVKKLAAAYLLACGPRTPADSLADAVELGAAIWYSLAELIRCDTVGAAAKTDVKRCITSMNSLLPVFALVHRVS
jgi:hypothetical protein